MPARHLRRELERLKRVRLAYRLRIQSLLVAQGVRPSVKRPLRLDSLASWDGRRLPLELKPALAREQEHPGAR